MSPPVDEPSAEFAEGDFSDAEEAIASEEQRDYEQSLLPTAQEAVDEAVALDRLTAVERSQFTTTYDLPSGLSAALLTNVPQNVPSDGEWVQASDFLTRTGDGWSGEAHPLYPEFAESAADGFTARNGGFTLSVRPLGMADADGSMHTRPRGEQGALVYDDIVPNADLTYELAPGAVKESVVVRSAPQSDLVLRWTIEGTGLSAEETPEGDILILDPAGLVRFVIPAPLMWDSSGEEGVREPVMTRVPTGLFDLGTHSVLVLRPQTDWLHDPQRVYPVTIDPTVGWGPSTQKSYKSDETPFNNSTHVGNTRQSSQNVYWRGFNQFPLSSLAGKIVADTEFGIQYAGTGTTNCFGGAINVATANPPTGYTYVGGQVSSYSNLCTGTT